ncbi:MFS transporter [Shewanella sp. OPT22]|nr:MFS transporter [Shewanella sp. OPT22]
MTILAKHPKGLFICFLTEMWERFSFYGLKALLIFYLTEHFLFTDKQATNIFGNYFALVYAFPLLGGYFADKYLGTTKAVTFGAILLCFGHLGMAIEGNPAYIDNQGVLVQSEALPIFYVSLSLIIVGVGFLKPNISGIVGKLYHINDPRKDAGFTIFYMGINLGAALAAIICGYAGRTYGWGYGFGLAGIGMLIGLITFLYGQKHLITSIKQESRTKLISTKWLGVSSSLWIYGGSLVLVALTSMMVSNHHVVASLLGFSLLIAAVWLIFYCLNESDSTARQKIYAAVTLTIMSTVFFLCFLQSGSSMNLFAERVTDRDIFGFIVPAPMLQSLNAIFIILLAPVLAKIWQTMGEKNIEPSTPIKFSIGLAQVGLGFGCLVLGIEFASEQHQVALVWLVLAYLLHTTGELFISPIGLSMITKLSAPRIVGLMLGLWFLGSAIAEYIAAWLAGNMTVPDAVSSTHPSLHLATYSELYTDIMIIAFGGALLTLILTPLIKKWMNDVT